MSGVRVTVAAGRPRPWTAAWALALVLACGAVRAACADDMPVRVTVEPRSATLGAEVRYRAWVVLPPGTQRARWRPPEAEPDVTWSDLAPRRVGGPTGDTLAVSASLQVFEIGSYTIPGLEFQIEDVSPPAVHRLPAVTIEITSVLPADDDAPALQPLRGPLEAPWWERVPWTWVVTGALALAAVLAYLMWRRRRRARGAPAPAVTPRHDPMAEALAALAELRRLDLPGQGRFAEHAFALSAIAKRFLEEVAKTPRPGDTTPELIDHLHAAALSSDETERIAELLRRWDRVKFARAPSDAAEAGRAEVGVESMIRKRIPAAAAGAA